MDIKINGCGLKKLDEKGEGIAVIATLNVIDKDGDVTVSGAFGEQMVPMVPAHQWDKAPIGKAKIHELGDEVLASFKLNLKNSLGKDWHESLKFDLDNPPSKQQYSYGFSIPEGGSERGMFQETEVRFLKTIQAHEISPVLLGAGIATRTLALKGDKRATPKHSTGTEDGPWSGTGNERNVIMGPTLVSNGPSIYAWKDPEADPETKTAWKFIHHFVNSDGTPGAASIRASIMGIAVLNGARGGTTTPERDRSGVWDHLVGHLKDADIDPPDLKSCDDELKISMVDQILITTWDIEDLIERVEEVKQMRLNQGRDLSEERINKIVDIKSLLIRLESLTVKKIPDHKEMEAVSRYMDLRKRSLDNKIKNL